MKKIFLYGILSFSAIIFSGCGEDFLYRVRPLDYSEEEVYSTAAKIEGNVVGLYASLKQNYIMGGRIFLVADNIGEDVINVSGNGVELNDTYNMKVGLNTQENSGLWQNAYLAINRCNTFLKLIEEHKDIAGDKYGQFVAEAKFCRAIAYYFLYNMYTTPYSVNPNALSVPLRLNAETIEGIYDNDLARSTSRQVIDQMLEDLSVSDALPAGNAKEATVARASKGAAEALKMRIYMITGEWQKAIDAGNKITGYSLVADVSTMYKAPYITTESIFSMAFADNNRGSAQSALAYYYIDGKSNVLNKTDGILTVEGYNIPSDERIVKLTNATSRGLLSMKFTTYPYTDWAPVFRYAEIGLNMAECYANLGNDAEARIYLKQVRERAIKPADDTINIDALSGDDLKKAIYNEQRLEFIGEGHRAFNAFRRGETIVKSFGSYAPSKGINGYIWPIPNIERLANSLIVDE